MNNLNHGVVVQVEPCSQFQDVSIYHQAHHKKDDDWEETTKRKRAKPKTVKSNSFVISTHNRFSYWEDETNEPVLCMIEEITTEKMNVIEGITKKNKVKVKKQRKQFETVSDGLKAFETKNMFSVLGSLQKLRLKQCWKLK